MGKQKKVLIVGGGFIGTPFAQFLHKNEVDYLVTARSESSVENLLAEGLNAFRFDLNSDFNTIPESFSEPDFVVLAFPPLKTSSSDYVAFLEKLVSMVFHKDLKVIYLSSTSVYNPNVGFFREDVDESVYQNGNANIRSAEHFISSLSCKSWVLRLGGLCGGNRMLLKYVSGKEIQNPNQTMNLVHQEDVVEVLGSILNNGIEAGTYNVVSPHHPTKIEFYTTQSLKYNLPMPLFKNQFSANQMRIVLVDKLLATGFNFRYADPKLFPHNFGD